LGYARYQGNFNTTSNITDFFSVRYAAPPTGKNRFQAPQPPQFQPGVQVANVRPAGCPQAGEGDLITNPFRNVLGTGTGIMKRSRAKRQTTTEIEDCLVLKSVVSSWDRFIGIFTTEPSVYMCLEKLNRRQRCLSYFGFTAEGTKL